MVLFDYANLIRFEQNKKQAYFKEISSIEEEIKNLELLRMKLILMSSQISSAAQATIQSMSKLTSITFSPLAVLKNAFFTDLLDVISGNNSNLVDVSIENSLSKSNNRIKELKMKIEELLRNIDLCNQRIYELESQKAQEISDNILGD